MIDGYLEHMMSGKKSEGNSQSAVTALQTFMTYFTVSPGKILIHMKDLFLREVLKIKMRCL